MRRDITLGLMGTNADIVAEGNRTLASMEDMLARMLELSERNAGTAERTAPRVLTAEIIFVTAALHFIVYFACRILAGYL